MEPLSPHRPIVPKLQLLLHPPEQPQESRDEDIRLDAVTDRQPLRRTVPRASAVHTMRACTASTPPQHLSIPGKILPPRVFAASVEYVESSMLPPVRCATTASKTNREKQMDDPKGPEFRILHPSLDLSDDTGELSRLMLSKWSIHSGEEQFTSTALFCEIKLGEAKRMASWVETPNRFFTVACCQLLEKFINRVDVNVETPTGAHGGSFLQKVFSELLTSIFLSGNNDYADRLPYFIEYKRLKRNMEVLVATMESRDKALSTRERLPGKIDKLAQRWRSRANKSSLSHIFRGWKRAIAAQREIRMLKCRVFHAMRKTSLSSMFRAWRIEALRRAYQRESVEYQTMLSITAASLSRKDIAISEAEAKISSMSRIIDSLTESNKQLAARIDQLERLVASGGREDENAEKNASEVTSRAAESRRVEVQFDRIDTLMAQDDGRMDHINRMLLETMFGMARMVESSAIQMAKDVMDSLEYQLDGSVLQNLAEMIQAENAQLAAAEANVNGSYSRRSKLVTIRDLAHMPVDALLLYWFRMNLQLSSSVEKASDRTIKNFTTDLIDGRRFSFLLHRLFPTFFDSTMVHEIDTDQRLRNIATFHARVQPELPSVVTTDSIHAGSATENVAFVAMLFGTSIGSVRRINLEKQRGDFLNIISSWRRVRGLLLEVKRMNDNYDALMISHLLKEMRTCETLFKQLNGELSSIAIASNETSSALSQVAYKILQLTWNCIRTRGVMQPISPSEAAAVELIDERWLERLREFASISTSTVRELLVRESEIEFRSTQAQGRGMRGRGSVTNVMTASMAPVIPERDVLTQAEALRRVLHVYSKDLHDIFKHYSASGGLGSVAALSLSEFNKFIKDCFASDKFITNAVAEQIYQACLQVPGQTGPVVPAAQSQDVVPTGEVPTDDAREMVGSEFVEALVRLAAAKFVSTRVPLPDKFSELMEQDVLPYALRSQSEIFRAEVASPKVREVFQRHKPELQRVFRYYTSMHTLRGQQSTLSLKEFVVFAKDCKLIGSFISEHTLKQVLVNLQREVEPGSENELRADFSDFQEAIAALTQYVICNPYVPLNKRVEQFINEMLLPRARQKKKTAGE